MLAEMIIEDPWDTAFREVLCKLNYVKVYILIVCEAKNVLINSNFYRSDLKLD